MTRFAAFPDIHDRPAQLKQIRHVLADVDAVLLPGDMTNGNVENMHTLLSIVEPYNEQIYAVCGNMDTDQINMMLAREGISIHRRHVMLNGLAIIGCGGALPFAGPYVFSDEQTAGFLEESMAGVAEDTPIILVCHQPPYGTKLDMTRDGQHVGSHAVRDFIERVQPLLCFCGHIHNAVGVDRLGQTRLINSGPIWQSNQYAYAEIEAEAVTTLEIRPVKALEI